MKIITLQAEIEADAIGWLVSESMKETVTIVAIELPAEITLQAGWTEVKFKEVKANAITPKILIEADNLTREMIGTDKVYLEQEYLVLKTNKNVLRGGHCIVFEVKNGTGTSRIYTVQVWYE